MADRTADFPLQIQTHYVKDLSFENPNAPEIFGLLMQSQPEVSLDMDVKSRHLTQRTFEVVLSLRVGANVDGKSAFLADLQYAALIDVLNEVPDEEIEPLLLKEGPRFIFPFARSALADVTREGGFPPLVVNPINFDRFYETNKQAQADGQAGEKPADEQASA